jgi:aspartyl-tRNA(Asn)/glutamyl-tRNA(Gln) amidotransferase subunit A
MNRREAIAALLAAPMATTRAWQQRAATVAQEDLTALTLAQASAKLASRQITPTQLVNAYVDRITAQNASLNAYVTVTTDLARQDAKNLRDPKGPLWGIPIAHKDLFETKGVRTTAGSQLFDDYIPDTNATIVQQLHDAGAIMLGKTNTHELGGGVTTINPFFGTTRNPADVKRIPGGSSGGSAAAVASRMCVAATGSDTGGSVRIPAAFCGCVGFKPTHGTFSTRGLIGASPTFDHVGVLTRTVEDAQILLSTLAPGTRHVAPGTMSAAPGTSPRIAVARRYFFDDLEPAVASAISEALGSSYPDIDFPVDAKTMERVFDPVMAFELWSRFGADWRTDPASFSKELAAFFATPRPSIAEYEDGLAALKAYQAAVDKLFDQVDAIVTPTVPITAPLIEGPIDGMKILRNTWPLNAAGIPAISVPVRSQNLPIGLQIIGRRGADDNLLRIARTFER